MIGLIVFLLIGAGLAVSLYLFARHSPRATGGAEALIKARHALTALRGSLLTGEVVGRILAREDRDYVSSAAPASVLELFVQQRRRIALAWVSQVRSQIISLRRFHFGRSRFYARLSFGSEVALALNFAMLLLACHMLQILFYFGGPYAAPRIVGKAVAVAGKVCGVSEKSLAFLSPVDIGAFGNRSAGNRAAE